MVSYDIHERLMTLDNDRKQLQTKLENLQYAMTVLESHIKNYNYDKQIKEVYDNLYCIIMGTVLGIVMFVLFVIH